MRPRGPVRGAARAPCYTDLGDCPRHGFATRLPQAALVRLGEIIVTRGSAETREYLRFHGP